MGYSCNIFLTIHIVELPVDSYQLRQQPNMENLENRNFSPLFRVKNILFILRCVFGFPLTPTNEEFDHFEFRTWFETLKQVLYLASVAFTFGCMTFLHMKNKDTKNPFKAIDEDLSPIGISNLDLGVVLTLPMTGCISNMMYFLSFKRRHLKLNKLFRLLRDVREKLHTTKRCCNLLSRKYSILYFARFIFVTTMAALAIGMLIFYWSNIVLTTLSFKHLSSTDRLMYCLAVAGIYILTIYPPMATSADVLVWHLLHEIGEAFVEFKQLIKSQNELDAISLGTNDSKNLIRNLKPRPSYSR